MHEPIPTRISLYVWRINAIEAYAIKRAAFERMFNAYIALQNEPTTPEWNKTIDRLHHQLDEAEKDFVNAHHVCELVDAAEDEDDEAEDEDEEEA
jgi:hypothetical protein